MPDLMGLGPWTWLIAGLILVGLETLAPGVFLVWLGVAAMLTGVGDWLLGMGWQANLILFAALALVSVLTGRALTRRPDEAEISNPTLNRRSAAMVGRVFTLDRPIASGEGRIRVDDSVWRVTGPDLESGRAVRVLRVEGATLVVEGA